MGVAHSATTLSFVDNNAVLANGVLNVSRLTHYDKRSLIFASAADKKDLVQSASGKLESNSIEMVSVNDLSNVAPTAIKITDTQSATKQITANASNQILYDGAALQLVQNSIT